MDPIKVYNNLNYHIKLYPNRIEIEQGMIVGKKTEVIPIKNIASFDIPFGKRAEIKTNDGKKHILNLMPNDAKDLQARLMDLL